MYDVMAPQHNFSTVPQAHIPRSVFNRTHALKTTFDAGYLVPIYWDLALPADTISLNLTAFCRLSTPIVPVMDNIYLDFFFFAVPIRLVWNEFVKMCGEQDNPADTISYTFPIVDVAGEAEMSLTDYFGLPINSVNAVEVNAIWFRSYNLIWNQWFRDENLQDSAVVDKDVGPDDIADYQLLRRGKRHDYFTSCLPWPQKSTTAVTLPFGTTAPIFGENMDFDGVADNNNYAQVLNDTVAQSGALRTLVTDSANLYGNSAGAGSGQLFADLASATAVTINEMREAFQIQKLLEMSARGGTRYTEIIRVAFGTISPDARLQRPEYLGGGSTRVNINPVARTNDFGAAQGADLSGYGVASGKVGFTASFTEHCVVIGLVSARADLTYQEGIDRHFLMSTRYDMYWPVLAHLGEQAVYNMELVYTDEALGTGSATNLAAFGYQERYAEYRYKPSKITGLFRSAAAGTLEVWHLSQDFGGVVPDLDNVFIEDDPPIDRIIATPTEPHFIYDSYVQMRHVRPMPVYGVPGLIDHF